MVLYNDKKYACETCIKGHRSSTCNHNDRPLFEIKKKGRPVTQCEHCRELRKSKQVHVKCLCEGKQDPVAIVSHSIPAKKANRLKGATPSAAFPHGLTGVDGLVTPPEADETFAAERHCACPAGGPCMCSSPRKSKDSKAVANRHKDAEQSSCSRSRTPPRSNVAGVGGRVRPIASRPPALPAGSSAPASSFPYPPSQVHPLSHGHASRPSHGAALFSPYGNAFDYSLNLNVPGQGSPAGAPSQHPASFAQHPSDLPMLGVPWSNENPSLNLFASLCQCGDSCICPGCVTHQASSALSVGASPATTCTNPGRCIACDNCSTDGFGIPGFSFDPSAQFQSVDWLSQMPAGLSGTTLPSLSAFPELGVSLSQGAANPNMGMDPTFGFGGGIGDPFNFSSNNGDFRSNLPNTPRGSISAPVSSANSTHSLHVPYPSAASSSTPVSRHSSFSPNNTMTQQTNFLSVINPAATLSRTPSTGSASSSSGSDSESSCFNRAGGSSATRMPPVARPLNPRTPYPSR